MTAIILFVAIVVIALGALDAAAVAWGADSRDPLPGRPPPLNPTAIHPEVSSMHPWTLYALEVANDREREQRQRRLLERSRARSSHDIRRGSDTRPRSRLRR